MGTATLPKKQAERLMPAFWASLPNKLAVLADST